MSVEVIVSEQTYKKLEEKPLLEAVKKAVTDTCLDLEGELKDYSPYETGHLQRHHSYQVQDNGKKITARMKNTARNKQGDLYWPYLEYGTKYIPPYGYIQRAIEVAEPAEQLGIRFHKAYKPGGK